MRIINNFKKFGLPYVVVTAKHKLFFWKKHFDMSDYLYLQRYYQKLPKERYAAELSAWYKRATGKELHLEKPIDFTEKIQWLKLHDSTPLKTLCADKLLAPKWAKERCERNNTIHKWGGVETVPILGAWDRAADIDFASLPDKFVLKCNHGSGMNIIVKDKAQLNIRKTRRQLDRWLKVDYAHIAGAFELHYSAIPRKIIAEQFIEEMDGNLHDYKIYCFGGRPMYILVIGDRNLAEHTGYEMLYDTEWNSTGITITYPAYKDGIERPAALERMLEIAKCLSEPFNYVRVDLYTIGEKVYFGEMTFTPASGAMIFSPPEADRILGDLLALA